MTEKGLRETSIVNPSSPPLCAGASACTHTFPCPHTEQQFIAVRQLSAGRLPEEHNRNPRSMQEGKNTKKLYFILFILFLQAELKGLRCTEKKKIREIQLWKRQELGHLPLDSQQRSLMALLPVGMFCGESLDRACSPRQFGKRNRAEVWV